MSVKKNIKRGAPASKNRQEDPVTSLYFDGKENMAALFGGNPLATQVGQMIGNYEYYILMEIVNINKFYILLKKMQIFRINESCSCYGFSPKLARN